MTIYAYLRVSTEQQSVEAQRGAVVEFAVKRNLIGQITYFEDTVSGYKVSWRKRKLKKLIDQLQAGDVVIFPEISRISRKLVEILEVLEILSTKQITVYVIKPEFSIEDTLMSKMFVMMMGFFSETERMLISQRTKEGQAAARARGNFAGRPKGSAETRMLDEWGDKIFHWLSLGLMQVDILRLINDGREKPLAVQTLIEWMRFRDVPLKRYVKNPDEYRTKLKESRVKFHDAMKKLKEKQEVKTKAVALSKGQSRTQA